MVPAEEVECPRCGAPLDKSAPIGEFQEQSLEEFVEEADQKLVKSGTSAAELAFGVGCTLSVLVGGFLLVIIFIAFTKTWTILAVIALIITMISVLVSSILASRAQKATSRSTFEREIKPEINNFIISHEMNKEQFVNQATEILPADSPLLVFISGQEI
jgi:ABC-type multidrug transport system fused ATPase/permease subunit